MNDRSAQPETGAICAEQPAQLVMTTVDSATAADALAAHLVEARLAACIQIVPVRSVYRWDGEVKRDAEWLLLIKTTAPFGEVEAALQAQHPYELPEIVQVPIDAGSADYLQWLREQTRNGPGG